MIKPELAKMHDIWERTRILIENDEEGLESNMVCFKHPNETQLSYSERKKVFVKGFVNPSIELITAPAQTIYQNEIRENVSEGTRLEMFTKNCTLGMKTRVSLVQHMREQLAHQLRAYGTVFMVIDMPEVGENVSEAKQRENRIWPYVNLIPVKNVVNYEISDGELLWFKYVCDHRELWENPLDKPPKTKTEYRIWTRSEYVRVDAKNNEVIKTRTHNLGFVPVVIQGLFNIKPNCMLGETPFAATSNLIITANAHLNAANFEVWKYVNSLLLMHVDCFDSANTEVDGQGRTILKKTPDGNMLPWAGENKPEYLSLNLDVVDRATQLYNRYIGEAFDNEKSARSVAKSGYDGSDAVKSGFAMVLEREPILANIVITAMACETAHNRVLEYADLWINDGQRTVEGNYVQYDKDYDIDSFEQTLTDTEKLKKIGTKSQTLIKERMKKIATREIKDMKLRQQAFQEIDTADYGDEYESDYMLNNRIENTEDNV